MSDTINLDGATYCEPGTRRLELTELVAPPPVTEALPYGPILRTVVVELTPYRRRGTVVWYGEYDGKKFYTDQ